MITTFLYLCAIAMLFISLALQSHVQKTYKEWAQRPAAKGWTGASLAHQMLNHHGIYDVKVQVCNDDGKKLSDNYNPKDKTVNLSPDVFYGNTVSALAVAAHECGHAIQYHERYMPIRCRTTLFPIAHLGSTLGFWMTIIGMLLTAFIPFAFILADIGILLFGFAVLFHLVTLPVEFNASNRALKVLTENGVLIQEEIPGAQKVLKAAAMTYVAAALAAIIQLFRFIGYNN